MTFTLDYITVSLKKQDKAIKIWVEDEESVLLSKLSMKEIEKIIKKNYKTVKTFYEKRTADGVPLRELNGMSVYIVLSYLAMYNQWKNFYEAHKNRDLTFLPEDFEQLYTYDLIISYFKKKYPKKYSEKCQKMLNMNEKEFQRYEKDREEFMERR